MIQKAEFFIVTAVKSWNLNNNNDNLISKAGAVLYGSLASWQFPCRLLVQKRLSTTPGQSIKTSVYHTITLKFRNYRLVVFFQQKDIDFFQRWQNNAATPDLWQANEPCRHIHVRFCQGTPWNVCSLGHVTALTIITPDLHKSQTPHNSRNN
jgi:hypothetical protein